MASVNSVADEDQPAPAREHAKFAIDGVEPNRVISPSSSSDVEAALSQATNNREAVTPVGGRTMLSLGNPPERYDLALDLSHMTRTVEYEANDFTISVEAGMAMAQLQQQLAEHGQFLPLDHPHFERATLGGLCAVGRGGLRRNAFGGPRDWLIGMKMVQADGTAIKGGGRVVKNVSGYDLPKLFAGSLGTLGVITEVTFKLRPQPINDQIIAITTDSFAIALDGARAAAAAAPSLNACVALSGPTAARAQASGAEILDDQPVIILRASGLESAVNEVLGQALTAMRAQGITSADRTTPDIVETWQAVVDLELATPTNHVRLRVGLPPANLRRACEVLTRQLSEVTSWLVAADSGLLFLETPDVDATRLDAIRR